MRRFGIVFLISFSMVACSFGPLKSNLLPEELLRHRAEAYWATIQRKDWNEVRSFVDPNTLSDLEGYFKKREEMKDFSDIVSFEIQRLSITGNEGHTATVVSLNLTHPLLGGKPQPLVQTVENKWVRRNGQWYVVIEPVNLGDILRELQKNPQGSASGG